MTLPSGLSIDPNTGVISGIPTAAGNSTFTVRGQDAAGVQFSKEFSLSVMPSGGGSKPLLSPSDVTFLGSYIFDSTSQDFGVTWGMGLTGRRVNGQLRFMTFRYNNGATPVAQLIEFTVPIAFGQTIPPTLTRWLDVWGPVYPTGPNAGGGDEYSLFWEDLGNGDDGVGRLITTHCTDYPGDGPAGVDNPFAIAVRTLNSDGSVSDVQGEWGFIGIGQRAIYGGVQPVPQSFRDKYGVPYKYIWGFGGYTSRVAQGLVPSLGLMGVMSGDVTTYPGTPLPTTAFAIVADHRSGTVAASDWYTTPGDTSQFDRGIRNSDVVNYYDGGDPRPNPSTPPTDPPFPGAQWLSPAPDGKGRYVWGDSYFGNAVWIDGPNKQGFIALGQFSKGKAYYEGSSLHADGRDCELQVFDPDHFGEVIQGTRQPWNVQPVASRLLTAEMQAFGSLLGPYGGDSPWNATAGTWFDAVDKILYTWHPGMAAVQNGYGCRLAAWAVDC